MGFWNQTKQFLKKTDTYIRDNFLSKRYYYTVKGRTGEVSKEQYERLRTLKPNRTQVPRVIGGKNITSVTQIQKQLPTGYKRAPTNIARTVQTKRKKRVQTPMDNPKWRKKHGY